MIHELDPTPATARCIDLPGTGDFGAATTWALVADPDDRNALGGQSRATAASSRSMRRTHVRRFRYSFAAAYWIANAGVAAMSPDGKQIAFTDAQHVWLAVPSTRRVIHERSHVATALGWAPDQSALWVVGERSRVSRLAPLRWR